MESGSLLAEIGAARDISRRIGGSFGGVGFTCGMSSGQQMGSSRITGGQGDGSLQDSTPSESEGGNARTVSVGEAAGAKANSRG